LKVSRQKAPPRRGFLFLGASFFWERGHARFPRNVRQLEKVLERVLVARYRVTLSDHSRHFVTLGGG